MENNNSLVWEEVNDISNLHHAINTEYITINKNVIQFPVRFASILNEKASLFYCASINKFKLIDDSNGQISLIPVVKNQKGKKICSAVYVRFIKSKLGDVKQVPCVIENDYLIIG